MPEVKSLLQLQDALDKEMSWRIKEIGVFQVGSKSNGTQRISFIRAGIALLYAHWEGFIKRAAELYLEFIESTGLRYTELKTCFCVFGLKGKLDTLVSGRQSAANVEALDFILAGLNERARLQISSAIKTESNLTSSVFSNIARSLDIETARYETKYHLIDASLVRRRNKVAHGQVLELDGRAFGQLVDDVFFLLRTFKTDIENAASLGSFKRNAA